MIYIALLSITILFFAFALLISPLIKRVFGLKLCAICAACSSTWLALLLCRHLEVVDIDDSLVAVLMGGSVVGIMFEIEKFFKKHSLRYFWIVRLTELTTGFLLAYAVASCNRTMIFIGFIGIIINLVLVSIMKKTGKKDNKKSQESQKPENSAEDEKAEAIKKLEESLEDCC